MDYPIVDAHLHIWDTRRLHYPWLDDVPLLNKPYLIQDYRQACGPILVEKMVFLQAEVDFARYQEEADWVTGVAETEDARIAGIIPWAPLELGDGARPALEKLAANPRIKAIRRIIQFEPDPEFCLRPDFVRGIQALPEYGLHFEICINHTQMANTVRLVEQCPNATFILNHIGKPDIRHHLMDPLAPAPGNLAALPNVWCKMSGLATEADHRGWTAGDLRPYIEHVVDTFGFGRIMFGGDWPVATQATTYPRWVETLEQAVAGSTPADVRKLFHDNAVSFYRLNAPAGLDLKVPAVRRTTEATCREGRLEAGLAVTPAPAHCPTRPTCTSSAPPAPSARGRAASGCSRPPRRPAQTARRR